MTDTFLILCLTIILGILIIRNLVLKQKAEFLKKINESISNDLSHYKRRSTFLEKRREELKADLEQSQLINKQFENSFKPR